MVTAVMVPVRSSNVAAIGYDGSARQLFVQFWNGAVYRYDRVPAQVHDGLRLRLTGATSTPTSRRVATRMSGWGRND
jgi:hypothetical protein